MSELVEYLQPADVRPLDRRWIAVSALLHACLIAALIFWWQPEEPAEAPLPLVKLVFDQPGAAGASGGGGGEAASGETSESTGDAAQPQPEAKQEAAQAAPPAPAATPPAQTPPETEAPVESAPTPPVPTPAPAVAETREPPPPPHPQRKPEHRVPTPPKPEIAAAPPPAPAEPAPAPAPAETATALAAPPGAGAGPGGEAGRGQGNEGAGRGVIGNGPLEGPGDDYLDALRRWLARYKKYPPDALKNNQEGKLVVGFTLERDGTVLDAWIVQSSGVQSLDQDAIAMLHRASPVPPVPERYKGAQLKLAMPLDYKIGFFDKLFK